MLSTECPNCGSPKNPNAKRCWTCGNEARRQSLIGVQHSEERRRKNSEAGKRGRPNQFDLGAFTRGKPSPKAVPMGSLYANKEGRIWVKVAEHGLRHHMWRRRAYVVWEAANGPVPRGRLLHHRNEDCADDRLENLQLVTRAEHARIHGTPERQRAAQSLAVAARKRNGTY